MKAVELDVSSSSVSLCVECTYELTVTLPEPVDADAVTAKFNKGSACLTVTMPCVC
jgi:HSP20 family molecular chaperone IbpA